jgi:hypothetical protein
MGLIFPSRYLLVVSMMIKCLLMKACHIYLNLIFQLFFSLHMFSSFKHKLNQLVGKRGMSTFHSYIVPFVSNLFSYKKYA